MHLTIDNISDYLMTLVEDNSISGEAIFHIISKMNVEDFDSLQNYVLNNLKEKGIKIVEETIDDTIEEEENASLLTYEEECNLSEIIIKGKNAEILLADNPGDTELEEMRENGDYARNELIINNEKLVAKIVSKYISYGNDKDELMQCGMMGLLTAAEKYDYRLGFRFSTYAYNWIRYEISKSLLSRGSVQFPIYLQNQISIVNKKKSELVARMGTENISVDLIAEELGGKYSSRRVSELLAINLSIDSLDKQIGDSEDSRLIIETVVDEKSINKNAEIFDYPDWWSKLSEMEQNVYLMKNIERLSRKEIADKINLSEASVKRYLNRAYIKIEKFKKINN